MNFALLEPVNRLDLAVVVLTCVAVIVTVGFFFNYFNMSRVAKKEAREVAERVAAQIAEKCANEYIQKELSNIAGEYQSFKPLKENMENSILEAQQKGNDDDKTI